MGKNTYSFYLPKELYNTLKERNPKPTVKSISQGLTFELESWFACLGYAMRKNKLIFNQTEIKLILDLFNRTEVNRGINSQEWFGPYLLELVTYGCECESLDKSWGINKKSLYDKIKNLPEFQRYALIDWSRQVLDGANNQGSFVLTREIKQFQEDK